MRFHASASTRQQSASSAHLATTTSSRRARRLHLDRAPATDQVSDSLAKGWLRVGGANLFGGKVVVDGQAIGFVPFERELPVGAHTLVVASPSSGQILVKQAIRIGGHNTRLKPLSVR